MTYFISQQKSARCFTIIKCNNFIIKRNTGLTNPNHKIMLGKATGLKTEDVLYIPVWINPALGGPCVCPV